MAYQPVVPRYAVLEAADPQQKLHVFEYIGSVRSEADADADAVSDPARVQRKRIEIVRDIEIPSNSCPEHQFLQAKLDKISEWMQILPPVYHEILQKDLTKMVELYQNFQREATIAPDAKFTQNNLDLPDNNPELVRWLPYTLVQGLDRTCTLLQLIIDLRKAMSETSKDKFVYPQNYAERTAQRNVAMAVICLKELTLRSGQVLENDLNFKDLGCSSTTDLYLALTQAPLRNIRNSYAHQLHTTDIGLLQQHGKDWDDLEYWVPQIQLHTFRIMAYVSGLLVEHVEWEVKNWRPLLARIDELEGTSRAQAHWPESAQPAGPVVWEDQPTGAELFLEEEYPTAFTEGFEGQSDFEVADGFEEQAELGFTEEDEERLNEIYQANSQSWVDYEKAQEESEPS